MAHRQSSNKAPDMAFALKYPFYFLTPDGELGQPFSLG